MLNLKINLYDQKSSPTNKMDESYVFPPPLTLLCPPSGLLLETTWLPAFPLVRNDQMGAEEIPPSPSLSMGGTSCSSSGSVATISPHQSAYLPLHTISNRSPYSNKEKHSEHGKLFSSIRPDSDEFVRPGNLENGAFSINISATSANANITSAQEDKMRELMFAKGFSSSNASRTLKLDNTAVDRLLRFQSLANRIWNESDPMLSFPFEANAIHEIPFKEPVRKASKASLFGGGGESFVSSSSSTNTASFRSKVSQSIVSSSLSPNKKLKLLENNKLGLLLRPQKTKSRGSPYVFEEDVRYGPSKSPSPIFLGEAENDVLSTWGGMAKALWGEDSIKMEENQTYLTVKQIQQQNGIRLDKGTLAQLKDWDTFYTTYTLALLNFNDMPPSPKGVPEFDACPDATPTYSGMLYAPIPKWEGIRLQSFHRLGVLKQDKIVRERISDILDEMRFLLPKLKICLRYIDYDDIYHHSRDLIYRDAQTGRRQSVCAHTMLNRNLGMQVYNFREDWRFKLPENEFLIEDDGHTAYDAHIYQPFRIDHSIKHYKFYTGVPILAADGLPMGVLSAWGKVPGRKNETLNLFLRQNARKIGTLLELGYCMNFVEKLEQMKLMYSNLPKHLPLLYDHSKNIIYDVGPSHSTRSGSREVFEVSICARNGLFVVPLEGEKVFSILVSIGSVTDFNCIYLAAITLPWASSTERRMDILAYVNDTDEPMQKLSYTFHEKLFDSASEPYIVLQSTNPALDPQIDGKEMPHAPFMNEDEFSLNRERVAGIFLAIKRNGKMGFVLGALVKSEDLVIGIEDLRFLQAVQVNIEEALTHFGHEYQERKKFPFKGSQKKRDHKSKAASQDLERCNTEANEQKIMRSSSLTSVREGKKTVRGNRPPSYDERYTRLPPGQPSQNSSPSRLQEKKDMNMYTIDETTWDVRMQSSQSTDTPGTNRDEELKRNRLITTQDAALMDKISAYRNSFEHQQHHAGPEHRKAQQIIDLSSQELTVSSTSGSFDRLDGFLRPPSVGLSPSPRRNRPKAATVSSAEAFKHMKLEQ
ncbi:uncharacterized protein FA14DRAFT_80159 [Meira miltonrushii]|uniref:GAF domain-containing protein n=1 Tax=Meira miltonrushii TaxID=1280837 RepID=A0A316V6C6_9BASI|nr:uncharacterized protein FA14DRAFT_80159 [Meira miltonrushii]PWN32992.1 hypothetical protein FA14DRAFT_80159 [Meira miltonrushii]